MNYVNIALIVFNIIITIFNFALGYIGWKESKKYKVKLVEYKGKVK